MLKQAKRMNYLLRAGFLVVCAIIAGRCLLQSHAGVLGDCYSSSVSSLPAFPTPPSDKPRSKITKLLMQYGDPYPTHERGIATHHPHNKLHGYQMSVLRRKTMPGRWSKPGLLLKVLLQELEKPIDNRQQWIFWFDADVVIMNPNIPLEIFLPPEVEWSHIHAVVTQDHHGLNNGVFALRVHEWSVWLISATLAFRTYLPRLELRFGDQSALEWMLLSDQFRNSTMHVPQRWFNAYIGIRGDGDYADPNMPQTKWKANSIQEGDLLVHHAGHPSQRIGRMEPWLQIADQHLPKWEVELEKTTYPDEIQDFWENQAGEEWIRVEKSRSRVMKNKMDKQTVQT